MGVLPSRERRAVSVAGRGSPRARRCRLSRRLPGGGRGRPWHFEFPFRGSIERI